jgi:hypothetical protein
VGGSSGPGTVVHAAFATGSIVSVSVDASALINNPRLGRENDELHHADPRAFPIHPAEYEMVIRLSKEEGDQAPFVRENTMPISYFRASREGRSMALVLLLVSTSCPLAAQPTSPSLRIRLHLDRPLRDVSSANEAERAIDRGLAPSVMALEVLYPGLQSRIGRGF